MKFVIWFSVVFLSLAGAYWCACTFMPVPFTLSNFSKYLYESIHKEIRHDRIFKDEDGVLLRDSFDHIALLDNWVELPKKKDEDFSYSMGVDLPGNTRCLSIVNMDDNGWTLQERHLIEVTEGDKISFDGNVRVRDMQPKSGIGMVLFNKHYQVLGFYYAIPDKFMGDLWKHVSLKFKVPKNVYYMRFMLSGHGHEVVSFDNVEVSRDK